MSSARLTRTAAQLYAAILRRRARGFDAGRRPATRLPGAVVSIGNLSLGGTAKTPATILLGGELRQLGFRLDVLSRGYRRRRHQLAVALDGREPAALVGDEPRLLARRLAVPVVVDRLRSRAGLEAERRFHTNLHLLDDGFQHRQLARDFDLVLLHPDDLDDFLLPAGRLREPLESLARASAIVLLAEPGTAATLDRDGLQNRVRRYSSAPLFFAQKRLPPPSVGVPVVAFCALARPASFFTGLERAGWQLAATVAFRDHHAYTARDLARLRRLLRHHGAAPATTEKDAMNLPEEHGLDRLEIIPLELDIERLPELVELIAAACRRHLSAAADAASEAGR